MDKTGTVFRGKAKIIPPDTFFLPYQKRWIEDESRLKLMEKGRQIGLSLSTAYRCVADKRHGDISKLDWHIVPCGEDEAESQRHGEVLQRCFAVLQRHCVSGFDGHSRRAGE